MATKLRSFYEVYPTDARAPVPYGIRINDMVYGGGIDGANPVTGALVADTEQQMRVALEKVKVLVAGAGGSLANVARATGFCTTEADRRRIDEVWLSVFPNEQDKPAFKQILADLPAGQLVRLECQALIGERRNRIDLPKVRAHDPTIRIGDWLFSSRCHGNDQVSGEVVAGGLEAETKQTLENLATLVKLAGGSESNIVSMTMFGRNPSYMPEARRIFEQRFPDPAQRPALNQLVNVIAPRFDVSIEMAALLERGRDEDRRQAVGGGERFQEIFLCPQHSSLPAGVRIGPLAFAAALTGADSCTRALPEGGLEAQLRGAFENMDRFLEAAGGGRQEIARVTVFLADLSERLILNPIWSELFPDPNDRPPHKYVPAVLPDGYLAVVQVMALIGAPRRVLEIAGVVHNDPMSMGALTGNLVTSSRIVTGQRLEDTDEHTRVVFGNAEALMKDAGGDFRGVTQITAFVGEAQYRQNVEKELRRRVGEGDDGPKLHILETNLGGGGAPRLEILGLL